MNDRSSLLARFPCASGDMVDPDCPTALPARVERLERRGEAVGCGSVSFGAGVGIRGKVGCGCAKAVRWALSVVGEAEG